MQEQTTLPSVEDYPGYFSGKPPILRRRRVQVIGAALAGILLGFAMEASQTASSAPTGQGLTEARVKARVAAAVRDAVHSERATADGELHNVTADLEATKQALADARVESRALRQQVRTVKAAARASRREAVEAAVAGAEAAKRRAVAAAVARTEAERRRHAAGQVRTSATPSGGSTDPQFDWCYEANAAGFGDYQQGVDPEYDWYDDSDNDGWVCER